MITKNSSTGGNEVIGAQPVTNQYAEYDYEKSNPAQQHHDPFAAQPSEQQQQYPQQYNEWDQYDVSN